MAYYDRINLSEGVDVNTTSASTDSNFCHYYYFLDKAFKFQPSVFNGCLDVYEPQQYRYFKYSWCRLSLYNHQN